MDQSEKERLEKVFSENNYGSITIKDSSGNVLDTPSKVPGLSYSGTTVYRTADGGWTTDKYDASHFTLDTNTGDINLTAPQEMFSTPEFDQIFDPDTIKSYSAAYKSNPSYRVPYTKLNDDGTTEETQITIPEFVEKLNDALANFSANYKVAQSNKKKLAEQYGDKMNKLSLTQLSQISSANASASRIYLPDLVFEDNNAFKPLENMRDEYGTVSAEDFMKYYQLGKTSETELAALMTDIEAELTNNKFETDKDIENAVAAMSLKNFILSKDPDAEWYESLGASAVTLTANAAEGIARIFMNIGTTVEGIATFGQVHIIQNATEEMDNAISQWNQDRMLIQDSTATLATIGRIGGIVAGTALEVYLTGKATSGISKAYATSAGKSLAIGKQALANSGLATGSAAYAALTPTTMLEIAGAYDQISLGAKFVLRTLPLVQKISIATNTAKTFMKAHEGLNFTTSFLLDTIHDAIAYDAVTLRHVLEGSEDQSVKDYWLMQLQDNAGWWIGMGFVTSTFKAIGHSPLGESIGAKITQDVKGLSAKVGDIKDHVKDLVYGGDFIRRMKEQLNDMPNGAKKNRLNNKIQLAEKAIEERKFNRIISEMDLEWETPFRLTEKSMEEFRTKLTALKDFDNAWNMRNVGLAQKEQEQFSLTRDPETGELRYANQTLGVRSTAAGDFYIDMMKLTQKYNLKTAVNSNLSEDIVDYVVGSIEKTRKLPIAEGNGPNKAKALADVEQITSNLKVIEDRLPDDVVAILKSPDTVNTYMDFYEAYRDYQIAKGLIEEADIEAYRNGNMSEGYVDRYAPVQKAVNAEGRFERFDKTSLMKIDDELDHFKYGVKEGQHYVDPEITRQRWMRRLAEQELSKPIKKAYDVFFGSSETVLASGEETTMAKALKSQKKDLNRAIAFNTESFTQNWKLDTSAPEVKRKVLKNLKWDKAEMQEITSMLSIQDTTTILQKYHVLEGGNTRLSNLVNAENYLEWFNSQSDTVKNYILDWYVKHGASDDVIEDATGGKLSQIIRASDEADGLEYFDVLPSTEEQRGLLDFSKENAVPGYESLADYYHKEKNLAADMIFMTPDEYLNALLEKNGGVKGYKSIDDILKRSRESDGKTLSEWDINRYNAGRGWKDYAEMMKNHDFYGYGEDGYSVGVKFHAPSITYGKDGYSGQEGIHRALAAREVGIKEMPVVVVHPYKDSPKVVDDLLNGKRRVGEAVYGPFKSADDIPTMEDAMPADYSLRDIESGKIPVSSRYRIAKKAALDKDFDGGNGLIAIRIQKGGVDKVYDTNTDFRSKRFSEELRSKYDLDGAAELETIYAGSSFNGKDANDIYGGDHDVLIFPVKKSDLIDVEHSGYGGTNAINYKKAAGYILDGGANSKNVEAIASLFGIEDEIADKLVKMDSSILKKIVDGDPKELLDLTGKKIVRFINSSADGREYRKIYFFPERNPELVQDGLDAMSKAPKGPMPGSEAYLKKRLDDLFNSKKNQDFLAKMGYDSGYHFYGDRGGGGNRTRFTYGHYDPSLDQIGFNWRFLEANLEDMEALEFHELSHMVWQRASDETRKAVGQDLINLLGIKGLEVDDAVACSKHMNELIAHSMETRFQSKKGWDVLRNDSFTKEHIDALAEYAGMKPTEGFKDRVMTLLRSLVTYIKTKILGINSAKTFDEFYYGLLNGDFADDLKTKLSEFNGLGRKYYEELRGKRNLTELDVPNESNFEVNVEDLSSGPINIDVNLSRSIPIEDLSEGPSDITVNGLKQNTGNDLLGILNSLPGRDTTTGVEASTFSGTNSYDLFKQAVQDGGDDFEAGLQRAYIMGDESIASKGLMTQLVSDLLDGKMAFNDGYIKFEARQALRNVLKLNTEDFVDSMYKSIEAATDDFVNNVLENPAVARAMNTISESGQNGVELSTKKQALEALVKKGGDAKKRLDQLIKKEVQTALTGKGLKYEDVQLCVKRAQNMAQEYIKTQIDDVRNALRTVNGALDDSSEYFKETQKLAEKIQSYGEEAKRRDSDVIMYLDDAGRQVYAKVDPNFASLFKLRRHMSATDASAFAKFNAVTSKLFRYGTTTLNLSSISNQLFRDTGNALIVGGGWHTIKYCADNMRDVFGDRVVEQIKRFDTPSAKYELQQIRDYAEAYGMTEGQAAISRELLKGAAISPATTETTLYKNILKQGRTSSIDAIDNMNHGLRKVLNKFESVDEWTNGKREVYLRNRVYANSLNDALEKGYNIEQARVYAAYAMNNATTNFSRQIYHMQAIADSTPYFKAAINGTKSFWRMWSVDPVGITGRMMGGLILPVIFLTGASLGDPRNKEVYKNIPEYQKDENFIFVVDGQIITIPMPQEMANIVNPFRQFVEYLHGANESDFWELMMNDALGFSPVDLTGFSAIDMDKLSQDPTISDRLTRGFARVFSQVAPVPVRSTYMMVTGTDPYTGKNLYDPSYTYWDDDTSSIQTMNDNQNAFAKWIAKLWGKESNATVLEKVTSSVFGSTGADALNALITLAEEGPGSAGGALAQSAIKQATNPYYADSYNQADAIWKRAVRALTAEKEAITSSDEFKTIYSELSQTKDEEKRKKLSAKGQDLIKDYQSKVINTVQRLTSVYKGTYDRKKFAATIQLLNFNTDPVYQAGTQYSSNIASDAYYEGRESAISTMQALGVTGTSDLSIFGYLTTDDNGNAVMKYSSPVAIMDMKNAWMGAGDVDTANIEAKLKTDGIKQSDMWDGYYAAKNQGKAALKQYKADWNAKVVKSLAPYISERGVDSVMKNTATRDLLDNYLFIDNLYQTKAYLKKIFENE